MVRLERWAIEMLLYSVPFTRSANIYDMIMGLLTYVAMYILYVG